MWVEIEQAISFLSLPSSTSIMEVRVLERESGKWGGRK